MKIQLIFLLPLLVLLVIFDGLSISRNNIEMMEICDNGIDDDADGDIDFNDEDCQCDPIVPSGLIPNPSFEDQTCCPQVKARLDCAIDWIQASAATTDYVHTCGFLGNVVAMPLPVPDGEGAIGMRDGSSDNGNFKEYAGACLTAQIEAGKSYRLRLNVGFRSPATSPPLMLSIYGHASCSSLPFGDGNPNIGCPLNSPGWRLLGQANVAGQDEWVEAEINFTTAENIGAVSIGPDCSPRALGNDQYYFFDNLRLAETIDFGYEVEIIGGNPCIPQLSLGLSSIGPNETYQWYRNGIAISNATQDTYSVPNDASREADYQVRIQDDSGCQFTIPFDVVIEDNNYVISDMACANSTYIFGSQNLTSSGMYTETFQDNMGCDSTVMLDLLFREDAITDWDTVICSGESIFIGQESFQETGTYSRFLKDEFGCDSLVNLTLQVRDPLVNFEFEDQSINLGDSLFISLNGQENVLDQFEWQSNGTSICSECPDQYVFPLNPSIISISAFDNNFCALNDSFLINVQKNYAVYIPNVFSPNGDGANDLFNIYPGSSIAQINSFRILDRWGTLVFEVLNTNEISWDGRHKGKELNMDTFVYFAEFTFIDGFQATRSGTVHIVR